MDRRLTLPLDSVWKEKLGFLLALSYRHPKSLGLGCAVPTRISLVYQSIASYNTALAITYKIGTGNPLPYIKARHIMVFVWYPPAYSRWDLWKWGYWMELARLNPLNVPLRKLGSDGPVVRG